MGEHGIYVAFDADGRHYAYVAHPDDYPDHRDDLKRDILKLKRAARRVGGHVSLVSSDEYKRAVLNAE